ncbi:MAG: Lin0512 family protein [Alphaproteobacteria bacterium]
MAKKRVLVEFGMGTSLRREDYTQAAVRAVKDALWHNSISVAELFDFPKDAMIIDVEIGVQKPDLVNAADVLAVFPYGQASLNVVEGGLNVPKPNDAGLTVIANAAIIVSFNMEPSNLSGAN